MTAPSIFFARYDYTEHGKYQNCVIYKKDWLSANKVSVFLFTDNNRQQPSTTDNKPTITDNNRQRPRSTDNKCCLASTSTSTSVR